MGQTIYQVDAFTDRPFAGNPAAVCILESAAEDTWMQQVAAEMNLAETAYLVPLEDGYNLRWFTPEVEVDLCGHATLASAHILWETGVLAENVQARFHTRSGLLTADKQGDEIRLGFPAVLEEETPAPEGLLEALGVRPLYVGQNRMDCIVELATEAEVRAVSPDFNLLAKVPVRGVIVTSRAETPEYDFVSRFFAPAAGILEDPVTGSAHCCLGPFWQRRMGKSAFSAYQASKRGGMVGVQVGEGRVYLTGKAVTVLRGELV